jgi:hypothetical protein
MYNGATRQPKPPAPLARPKILKLNHEAILRDVQGNVKSIGNDYLTRQAETHDKPANDEVRAKLSVEAAKSPTTKRPWSDPTGGQNDHERFQESFR